MRCRAVRLGRDIENAVGVNVVGELDHSGAFGRGFNSFDVEFGEQVVVLGQSALTFVDSDAGRGLVVLRGGKRALSAGRDCRVAGDQHLHEAFGGFDTSAEGSNVDQKHILDLGGVDAAQDGTLDCGAEADGLVGVDRLVEDLAAEEVGQLLLDFRHAGRTADQHNVVNFRLVEASLFQDLLHRGEAAAEKVKAKFLKFVAGKLDVEIFALGQALALNHGRLGGGEDALGVLDGGPQAAVGLYILGDGNVGAP